MESLPWQPSYDATVIDRMPTFAIIECQWFALSILCLAHALMQDTHNRRNHLLLWVVAVFAGSMNDIIFMWLPLVDNFFHAQATFMLHDRLPAYILCVYQVLLYVPTAFVWQYITSRSRYASVIPPLTAFLAVAFYGSFDIVGVKFLWWTWHDTDNNTDPRVLGVPVSSTMWVAVFSFVFSCLLNWRIAKAEIGDRSALFYVSSFLCVCVPSVPLMMVHMALVQIVVGQSLPPQLVPPNLDMLAFTAGAYGLLLCFGVFFSRHVGPVSEAGSGNPPPKRNASASATYKTISAGFNFSYLLHVVLVLHFVGLLVIAQGWIGDSKSHVSAGIHQSIGPCGLTAADYSGFTRNVHVCESNMIHRDYYEFIDNDTTGSSERVAEINWYSIRGLPLSKDWSSSVSNMIGGCWVAFLMIDWCLTILCLVSGENQNEKIKTNIDKKD